MASKSAAVRVGFFFTGTSVVSPNLLLLLSNLGATLSLLEEDLVVMLLSGSSPRGLVPEGLVCRPDTLLLDLEGDLECDLLLIGDTDLSVGLLCEDSERCLPLRRALERLLNLDLAGDLDLHLLLDWELSSVTELIRDSE